MLRFTVAPQKFAIEDSLCFAANSLAIETYEGGQILVRSAFSTEVAPPAATAGD